LVEELANARRAIDALFDARVENLLGDAGRPQDVRAELDEIGRQRREAIARFEENQRRQAAPAIFGLADQVANAVLQGPSRAALQATDVSTVQGASELNRLLRGEDAARDQNLVELQKQSDLLQKLLEEARNPQVAN
jgi:hypothetical protein